MKYMILNNKQMSQFCKTNINFCKEYSYEFTNGLSEISSKAKQCQKDLLNKINSSDRYISKEDQLFDSTISESLTKEGLVNPAIYYRLLHDLATAYGLSGIFTLLLFSDKFDFIGSVNLGISLDGMTATISDFFIVSKFRGHKYGKLLLNLTIDKLKEMKSIKKVLLEVNPGNKIAYNMYKKSNFIPIVAFDQRPIRMEYWIY